MATYDLTKTTPSKIVTGDILNCPYSGTIKSLILPKGKYRLQVWGAQGSRGTGAGSPGLGGYSMGDVTLPSDTTVYIAAGGSTGYNGGGQGYNEGGSGGGGSDIRVLSNSFNYRIIVAGGGGGSQAKYGGYGGGTKGEVCGAGFGTNQGAGTQTGGYSFGSGGPSLRGSDTFYGGAGGGGWYGGYGSKTDGSLVDDKGGSGGSGYIYTASNYTNHPYAQVLGPTYYLTSATLCAGNIAFVSPSGVTENGHSGNGYCRITALEVSNKAGIFVNIGGTWKPMIIS